MADNVPDWASASTNVPQSTSAQSAPSWATQSAQGGAPAWAGPQKTDWMGLAGRAVMQGVEDTKEFYQGIEDKVLPSLPFARQIGGAVAGSVTGHGLANAPTSQQEATNLNLPTPATMPQRVFSKGVEFGTQALTNGPSGELGSAAKMATQAARTLGEGALAGTAYQGAEEANMPDWAKQSLAMGASMIVPGSHAALEMAGRRLADAADAAKKTADVQQNLQASTMGVNKPSDFVTNLYKDRGLDTTPPDDPRTLSVTPMTGEPLSAADNEQYQQILSKGSEDDIKQFYDSRNGPAPSWADVHEWVNRRDAVNDGTAPADYADDMFKPAPPASDTRPAVENHIVNETANWKNAPDFEVINHVNDIQDPEVRQQAIEQGADNPDALGFLGGDGKVRIFANRIDSPDTLNSVLYHEALGHYGLAQQFGDRLDSTIQTLMDRNVGQFGKDVDDWQKANPGAYNGDRVRAAEEVLANKSNNGQIKPSIMDALSAHVRNFGRKMGLKLAYSDNEITTILGMAHDAVINGKGRDVVGNGFSVAKDHSGYKATDFGAATSDSTLKFNKTQQDETPKFMRKGDLAPKDIAEEAYERLGKDYTPKYRSWDDAKAAAEENAIDLKAVKDSRSVGNLDKKLFIYDAAAKEANTTLTALAKKAETEGLTDAEHVLGMETAAHFSYVLGRIENDSSQIGRALNAMKAISFSRNNLIGLRDALEKGETNMEALSDPDTMLKFLKQYNTLSSRVNPAGANALIKGVTKPYWWQYLLSYRQNMMLSGLSTHLKSTMDMATSIAREVQETAVALPAGAVRDTLRTMGMKNVKPGVHPSELAAQLWGTIRAVTEAKTWKDSGDAFVNGAPISSRVGNIKDPRIPIVSKVSDAISAQDTFFRSVGMNKNLYAIGARMARENLLNTTGKASLDDIMTMGSNYARYPTQEMLSEAKDLTENSMLLNRTPLNAAIDAAKRIRPGMNGIEQFGSFVTNLLTPFIRVGSNALMNQIIRRSPLAFLDPMTRADFAAGGARRDIAVARVAMGTALIGMYWNAADPKKNQVTGEGPDNTNKLKELEASGWSPNSIHENGRYNKTSNINFSLNPFDKHNNLATMVAGFREAYEKGANQGQVGTGIKLALEAVLHNLANQTFVGDLAPAVDAVTAKGTDARQKVTRFAQDEARTLMPNITTQVAKIVDPNQHDTRADGSIGGQVAATVQSSIPGASKGVPIRYSVYGQPLKTGTSITGIHTWVDQGNGTTETHDPVEKELGRLDSLIAGPLVTPVQRTIKVDGNAKKLTSTEFEQYQQLAGRAIVETVRGEMNSPSWASMSDQDKVLEVRDIERDMKKAAREQLYGK